MSTRKKLVWVSVGVAVAAIVGIGMTLGAFAHPTSVGELQKDDAETQPDADLVSVKTIRPRRDPNFRVSVRQLGRVEAYYQAELRARAAGVVKYVAKDVGATVHRGELLVEIDVPDLRFEVEQKEAVIAQRHQELAVARSQLKTVKAQVEVARANVDQKLTEVRQLEATLDLRRKRLARYRQLAGKDAISPILIEEQERDVEAAEAAVEGAKVAVRKARADLAEKESSVEAALAEEKLKEALVVVARKDRDRAQALADYARVTAPFDGVVTRRLVDPGAFVQNSTTAHTDPLIVVSRTDFVTVSLRLPENAAPFVRRATEAVVEMDDLPGVTISGRVTRFSPAIRESDRTMLVEVDLFNGNQADFFRSAGRLVGRETAALLGALNPLRLAVVGAANRFAATDGGKDAADVLAPWPSTAPACTGPHRLLPGMTGYIRLYLDHFTNACLLPSSAVFSRGGKPYILVVKDGVTRQVPVKVQVDDGRLVKVAILTRPNGSRGPQVLRELTGNEEVVLNRQLEVGEGQKVRVTREDW